METSIRARALFAAVFLLLTSQVALALPQHPVPYPRVDTAIGYRVDPNWPLEKPPGGDWAAMSSVAVGPDGNVWTFNRGKIPVQVFTPEGKLVNSWGEGFFKNPHNIRPDGAGNVWIIDTPSQTGVQFSTDSKRLMTTG